MTVREAILENSDKYIKLGFGVSFVYCDKPTESVWDEIAKQEQYARDALENALQGLLAFRKRLRRYGVDAYVSKCLEAWERQNKDFVENEKKQFRREVYCRTKRQRAESVPKLIAEKRKQIRTFKPLLERKVTKIYPSIYEGTIIILAKEEKYKINGRFWDVDEYQNWKRTGQIHEQDKIRGDYVSELLSVEF